MRVFVLPDAINAFMVTSVYWPLLARFSDASLESSAKAQLAAMRRCGSKSVLFLLPKRIFHVHFSALPFLLFTA